MQALAAFFKIEPDEILVVHDELDLQPGDVRLKKGGGVAGHNGLKDIAAASVPSSGACASASAIPATAHEVADYVLQPPREEETELIATPSSAASPCGR